MIVPPLESSNLALGGLLLGDRDVVGRSVGEGFCPVALRSIRFSSKGLFRVAIGTLMTNSSSAMGAAAEFVSRFGQGLPILWLVRRWSNGPDE